MSTCLGRNSWPDHSSFTGPPCAFASEWSNGWDTEKPRNKLNG
ncbi:MAG TPA: hypothetical protein PL002_07655 [Flavobacteriales bacterium]|nr:hypothetical protein [Flavobacteriales bacterium]HRT52575.1 hypothetical protein [Flavobacteriales bacterium]